MQSVHAGVVQTHFFSFTLFLKNSSLGSSFWVHSESHFPQKSQFWMKRRCFKNCFKKSDPPKSKDSLLTCREAPGQAASRTFLLNKKTLSGTETTTTDHFWVNFWAVVLEWVIFWIDVWKSVNLLMEFETKKRSNCKSFCSLSLLRCDCFEILPLWVYSPRPISGGTGLKALCGGEYVNKRSGLLLLIFIKNESLHVCASLEANFHWRQWDTACIRCWVCI